MKNHPKKETKNSPRRLGKLTHAEVNAILAQTDWVRFWQQVGEQARPELEAYQKSLGALARRGLVEVGPQLA